jgi:membrane protein implicated in regulation of membrane protease activity
MQTIIDLLSGLGFWNWVLLGLLLMALETVVPGVHLLWFGLSAVVVGALALALSALGHAELFTWPWQLVAFAIVSVMTVFWVRGMARQEQAATDEPALNVRGAQYVGRLVTVEEAITSGRGRVRVGDTLWPAQGADAAKGARVRVTGVNGTVLVVEPT